MKDGISDIINSKPVPITVGSWSGRGTRGIVPHDCFDAPTIAEAIAIINGTSTH